MTFNYEKADLSKTIMHYVVRENRILVYYLDGIISCEGEYSIQAERNILSIMAKQAEERSAVMNINKVKAIALFSFFSLVSGLGVGGATVLNPSLFSNLNSFLVLSLCVGDIVFSLYHFLMTAPYLSELEKYEIYLKMAHEFANYKIFIDARDFERALNLTMNTLDDYSLKEIKHLKKEYYRSFEIKRSTDKF